MREMSVFFARSQKSASHGTREGQTPLTKGPNAGAFSKRRLCMSKGTVMEGQKQHHHGPGCGHVAVEHNAHTDYLRHGHLEHEEAGRLEEHKIEVDQAHPDR